VKDDMSTPQEIQSQIEQTRQTLSSDVDRLTDKVSPSKVVGRRVESIKGTATSVKDRVMGSAEGVRGAGDALGSTASSIGDAASEAPQAVRRQTQGNPLAAGLIAFGVGWLASSVFPASQPERQLAAAAQDRATELAEPLKATAQELAGNLQEPLQQSVDQIKATATDAANQTAEHARSAVQDVKEPLQS
jgi:hypothetical protein